MTHTASQAPTLPSQPACAACSPWALGFPPGLSQELLLQGCVLSPHPRGAAQSMGPQGHTGRAAPLLLAFTLQHIPRGTRLPPWAPLPWDLPTATRVLYLCGQGQPALPFLGADPPCSRLPVKQLGELGSGKLGLQNAEAAHARDRKEEVWGWSCHHPGSPGQCGG